MSNTKTVMGQASNQYVAPLQLEDVFSTYLYEGNGSTQTITNGIDLDGEGGLVWIKGRNATTNHALVDTERGGANSIASDTTAAQRTDGAYGLTFNSNGFDSTGGNLNVSGREQASWTFRKAPKFFDVIKYSGDSNATRSIPHGLGSSVGTIIIKTLNANDNWLVYHRGLPNGLGTGRLKLNLNNAVDGTTNFLSADSSSVTFASNAGGNYSGNEYVMYLFAHNDGDGGFGADGDADIIKCGSYTGTGSAGHFIDLGFEPQWLMIKRTDAAASWEMLDVMRGLPAGGEGSYLRADKTNAEATSSNHSVTPSPTGFTINSTSGINGNNDSFIYIAIRRPTKVPESATEVFAQDFNRSAEANAAGVQYYSGWPVDMSLFSGSLSGGGDHNLRSRLTGDGRMNSNLTDAETSAGTPWWDTNEGWKTDSGGSLNTNALTWMWKRAPKFFDVVATKSLNGPVSHNLKVAPELVIYKTRNFANDWFVCSTVNGYGVLNTTASFGGTGNGLGVGPVYADATATTIHGGYVFNGTTTADMIIYLFASLDGISKVGSYTGTGSTNITIDCGFTSGARFVMIKRTDASGGWWVADTSRGIVSGNEPLLALDSSGAEVTGFNMVEPSSSGFIVNGGAGKDNSWNDSGGSYLFYAIA